ncbi:MFS transporter [Actinokineospora enzanensis]|uniref:MFS transporter n=1 Tax=Actinokineospora enzanensis TaxID=155975 RepID=UPI0003738FE3|nr:MFS transporter [Actinokineospora enzanensis]
MSADAPDGVFAVLRATPRPVRFLLTGVLVNQLGAFVQTFLILYLTVHGGLSAALAGGALVAYSVGTIVGTMVGGELTERIGPRNTIAAVMGVSAPLIAVIPLLGKPATIIPLYLVVALTGAATQAYRPAAAVLLSDLMPEKYQVMAFSMMRIALNTGAALAPLIAAGVILVNWDLLYWIDASTALVYAVLVMSLLPARTAKHADHAEESEEDTADTAAPASGSAYRAMLRDRHFLFYLGAVFLGTIVYLQSNIALPLEVVGDGYSTGLYSLVLTISSVVLITCELKITTYIARLPVHFAVFTGHVVNSVGLLCYAFAPHSTAFVLAGAVLVVSGLMIGAPSMFAHPASFPAGRKARYIATMHAVTGLGSAAGPLIGVALWSLLGGGFWVLIAVTNVVAGSLALAGLRRPKQEPTPKQPAKHGKQAGPVAPEVAGSEA